MEMALGLAGVSLLVSAWVGYVKNDTTLVSRISVVETQQKNDGSKLERMENKLDRILEKLP